MIQAKVISYLREVLKNMPAGWLDITTHRLDIYDEKLAKVQFLDQFEALYQNNDASPSALAQLPTAYDYIRLGHPLSCVLEWAVAKLNGLQADNAISFSSKTIPILAILRKNLLEQKKTLLLYTHELPKALDVDVLKKVYGYTFETKKVATAPTKKEFEGSTVFISENLESFHFDKATNEGIDFYVSLHQTVGSLLLISKENTPYIKDIQHVRRRETVAMTPANTLEALQSLVSNEHTIIEGNNVASHKLQVINSIAKITEAHTDALVGSSGLSIQYAIMMGLIDDAYQNHQGKDIKFIVPPNCYGGTNDQARRVAACINNVEVVDLPVDGDNDMVQSIHTVLEAIATQDAVPYIIAEIPTNPRVEVPDLQKLKEALSKERFTKEGHKAVAPVFILDQTFCPNVHFLGEGKILSTVKAISYASGSKFPSGGKCTAGYCVGNVLVEEAMRAISKHLQICDNEATSHQYAILATQLPSMNQRIAEAYKNTRDFVQFIEKTLPEAKINFVSQILAEQGFTPSVFSMDLPTKGNTPEEKEAYKRALNLKLINMMITQIPNDSKYCVSYGQLKGCYWTIPATSTQGTTKEGDKDYIIRASLSPDMDMEHHKKVFSEFVEAL